MNPDDLRDLGALRHDLDAAVPQHLEEEVVWAFRVHQRPDGACATTTGSPCRRASRHACWRRSGSTRRARTGGHHHSDGSRGTGARRRAPRRGRRGRVVRPAAVVR